MRLKILSFSQLPLFGGARCISMRLNSQCIFDLTASHYIAVHAPVIPIHEPSTL